MRTISAGPQLRTFSDALNMLNSEKCRTYHPCNFNSKSSQMIFAALSLAKLCLEKTSTKSSRTCTDKIPTPVNSNLPESVGIIFALTLEWPPYKSDLGPAKSFIHIYSCFNFSNTSKINICKAPCEDNNA